MLEPVKNGKVTAQGLESMKNINIASTENRTSQNHKMKKRVSYQCSRRKCLNLTNNSCSRLLNKTVLFTAPHIDAIVNTFRVGLRVLLGLQCVNSVQFFFEGICHSFDGAAIRCFDWLPKYCCRKKKDSRNKDWRPHPASKFFSVVMQTDTWKAALRASCASTSVRFSLEEGGEHLCHKTKIFDLITQQFLILCAGTVQLSILLQRNYTKNLYMACQIFFMKKYYA